MAAAALASLGAAPAAAQESGEGTLALDPAEPLTGTAATAEDSTQLAPDDGSAGTSAAASLTIHADRERLRLGQKVTFTGRLQPARRGRTITLRYKPVGGTFDTVAETRTDAQGRYEVSAKPRRNGVFRVSSPRRSGNVIHSRREQIEVRVRIELRARRHQLAVRGVKLKGRLRPGGTDRRVRIERRTGKGWLRVAVAKTDRRGDFRARWKSPELGGYKLRARFRGDDRNLGARQALPKRVHVYRADHASFYGPGFFGNTTACGQTLRRNTVGVAHKKIRCGAKVRFHYKGRTRKIPVIDRGPFIEGRRWDLTEAARKELRFPKGVDEVWANR